MVVKLFDIIILIQSIVKCVLLLIKLTIFWQGGRDATFIGNIGELREEKEEWSQYSERLDHFLLANGIEDEKKKDIFLAVIGLQTYKLLKSLVASAKPGEKEYNQLVELLAQNYELAPSEIVQRYQFNTRVHCEDEPVVAYMSELCGLVQFYNFGEALETMLKDFLICGINDEAIHAIC